MKAKILSFLILCSTFSFAQEVVFEDEQFKQMLLRERCVNKYSHGNETTFSTIDTNNNGRIEQNELDDVKILNNTDSHSPVHHVFTLNSGQTNTNSYNWYLSFPSFDSSKQYSQNEIDDLYFRNQIIINEYKPTYYVKNLNDLNKVKNLKEIILSENWLNNTIITSLQLTNLSKLEKIDINPLLKKIMIIQQLRLFNSQKNSYDFFNLPPKNPYFYDFTISNLEVINCPLLNNINATNINLTNLNISTLTALTNLDCSGNKLTSLDVTKNSALKELNCNSNQLTSLDVTKNTVLSKLYSNYNKLNTLDVSKNTALTELSCYYNQLTSLDVSKSSVLTKLECYNNQLTSLDVTKNIALKELNCNSNQLTSLDVTKNTVLSKLYSNYNKLNTLDVSKSTALTSLYCSNNQITSLDVSQNTALTSLYCSNNQITSLDVSKNTALTSLSCDNNKLTSLDVSKNKFLYELYIYINPLTTLNLKNGIKNYLGEGFYKTPLLKYICCDESELSQVKSNATSNGISPEINTYCSFAPNGNKNTITGKLTFDVTNNGCDANDVLAKNLKVKLNDGTNTGYSLTNDTANYTFYTQTGNFTLTPIFENPYFTAIPATISFADANNNTKVQDFCIKPIANKNDLEVKIIPKDRARPGFNSKYELIYKNKGTTTLNGNVNFVFNKNYSAFQSSSVVPTTNSNGTILYSFSNLKPFEEKIITIELKHNTPQASSFPLNGGDILNFSSIINPTTNDETVNDNTFALKQDVVNAYDPNDKTCLQGNSITPDMIGNYVDYQIRFENNGSAEATFIVVKDVIDTNLFDIETLTPTSSSHPYHLTIKNGNVVEFYFEDINLPFAPANANDPKAQGFVSFKIKTKSTLKVGDVLKNKADIYFDYNKPILTNEEQTKIENLSTENSILNTQYSILFTNPAKDKITFSEEVKSVQVFDLNGKLVQSSIINGTEMNVSSLQKGTYILKISTENGMKTSKLVKL